MADLAFEMKRAEARGDKNVPGNKFSGEMRTGENPSFVKGEVFTIPENYQVKTGRFGDYTFGITEAGLARQIFPGTFWKNREIYEVDENGRPKATGERDEAKGSAVELFKSKASIEEGMQALKGKKIKVTDVRTIQTLDFNNPNRIRNTVMYTLDLVK